MPARRAYTGLAGPAGYRQAVRPHNPYTPSSRTPHRVPQLPAPVDDVEAHPGPVHVVAIVDRYPPLVNAGGESMLAALLEPLAARGDRVSVVTHTPEQYKRHGVDVYPRSDRDRLVPQADVVVGHLMWTREAVEQAARHGKPLVYLVHNHRQLRHWSLTPDNVTVLAVNSDELARNVQTPRRRGRPDSWSRGLDTWDGPSITVRPPVRLAAWHRTDDPAGRTHVTLVNVQPAKGSGLFYALAARPNRRRWLAVEGGYGNQVRPTAANPGVEWQPQTADMAGDVYARTRVLLMPSDYESWGMAAVEAMASGIPVIAHPTAGLRESLADGAVFLDRDDVDAWGAELERLDDPGYYADRAAAGLHRALQLDLQAEADLSVWQQAISAAATVARVPSGR